MSVRKDAPYKDKLCLKDKTVIYEGHNVYKNFNNTNGNPEYIDQPYYTPDHALTDNGKFYNAALEYKKRGHTPDIVKVYEKIKVGVWLYNGFFELIDAWQEEQICSNKKTRKVFKFKLKMIEDEENIKTDIELGYNRLIPTDVKVAVFNRDGGKCVKCGSTTNLHFDHIIPFSKGNSFEDVDNIQFLCQNCLLKKHNKTM